MCQDTREQRGKKHKNFDFEISYCSIMTNNNKATNWSGQKLTRSSSRAFPELSLCIILPHWIHGEPRGESWGESRGELSLDLNRAPLRSIVKSSATIQSMICQFSSILKILFAEVAKVRMLLCFMNFVAMFWRRFVVSDLTLKNFVIIIS